MAGAPLFRLFGFPIHVRAGFLVFIGLVVFLNGIELGVWIAGSAAVLTLLHELGHAFAARATGAKAEIALDFLAGYASFVPVRPLRPWERAGISLAGPAVQIGVSLAVLAAMGVDPLDHESYTSSAAALAIWWTGPVMGLLNLVPVLPLDGGHVVQAALDKVVPGRSRTIMLWLSIALTAAAGIWFFTNPRLAGFGYFVILPLLFQLQMLFANRSEPGRSRSPAAVAESHAWETGDVERMPDGVLPSPWFRAWQQLAQGQPAVARDVLVTDFAATGRPDWWPPDTAPPERLAALVDLLPRPLPTGRTHSEHALAMVLLRLGRFADAAHYAADSHRRSPTTTSALLVARAAGALDDRDTCIGWLTAAVDVGSDPQGAAITLDLAPELDAVRADPRVVALRHRLEP